MVAWFGIAEIVGMSFTALTVSLKDVDAENCPSDTVTVMMVTLETLSADGSFGAGVTNRARLTQLPPKNTF